MSACDLDSADGIDADEQLAIRVTPVGYALVAVTILLNGAASDPDLRRVLRAHGDLFEELCVVEAGLLGRPAADVIAERSAQVPQGPRRYLSMREWHAVKAREIEHEGELGSHWPDKERHVSTR
jgi:hypothetical protein